MTLLDVMNVDQIQLLQIFNNDVKRNSKMALPIVVENNSPHI
jgi:hypothetical protein